MHGDWRGPAMPAQFALRVGVLGGVALLAFAIIFLRLWYLEVLSGDKYLAEAQNNQVRELTVQAPRGDIVDRKGQTLVQNRTALELQVESDELPGRIERRRRLFERVGELIGRTPAQIRKTIRKQERLVPGAAVTLRRDVRYDVVYYLRENQAKFPGVTVERVFVRRYPQGNLAAHLLGYVGEVSPEQLDDPRFETLEPGDIVGKQGVEYTYDSLLRGVNGETRVKVDASGAPTGGRLDVREPRTGNDLALTIDSEVQAAGEAAIGSIGLPAGFVAMKINNGEILGMGSAPTFDPSLFAAPAVSPATYRAVFGDPEDPASTLAAPAVNRAAEGVYPTGSTFKPITALAALDSGELGLNEIINDTGSFDPGDGNVLHNAGDAVNGPIDLVDALRVSSDVFFYIMGPAPTSTQERGERCRSGPGRSASASRPASTSAARRLATCRLRKGATRRSRRTLIQAGRAASRSTSPRASSLSGAGRSATTSTSPSARATCRPTRCRWRSPTGRSRTAARSCARTSGSRSATPRAARSRRSSRHRAVRSRSIPPGNGRSCPASETRR